MYAYLTQKAGAYALLEEKAAADASLMNELRPSLIFVTTLHGPGEGMRQAAGGLRRSAGGPLHEAIRNGQSGTCKKEDILREALGSLGQFEGLDNFKWLDNLKRKLDMPVKTKDRPVISFARNSVLQIPENLLGQLYSAISRRKVVRFGYRRFQDARLPFKKVTVHPYQLRQYNNRWFLLCNPAGNDEFPFDPSLLYTYALDRMDGQVEYVEDVQYIDTTIDIGMQVADGVLTFATSNPIRIKPKDENHEGIGIENSRKRLDLVYSNNYSLDINETDDQFDVKLIINLNPHKQ